MISGLKFRLAIVVKFQMSAEKYSRITRGIPVNSFRFAIGRKPRTKSHSAHSSSFEKRRAEGGRCEHTRYMSWAQIAPFAE